MLSTRLASCRLLTRSSGIWSSTSSRSITQLPVKPYRWSIWKRLLTLGGSMGLLLPAAFFAYYGSVEAIEAKVSELERRQDELERTRPTWSQIVEGAKARMGEVWPVETSDSGSQRPIWTPPTRRTPDEELEWLNQLKARHEEKFRARRWIFHNPVVEQHFINVTDYTIDKRMSDWLNSEDRDEFMPDMGAPLEKDEEKRKKQQQQQLQQRKEANQESELEEDDHQ